MLNPILLRFLLVASHLFLLVLIGGCGPDRTRDRSNTEFVEDDAEANEACVEACAAAADLRAQCEPALPPLTNCEARCRDTESSQGHQDCLQDQGEGACDDYTFTACTSNPAAMTCLVNGMCDMFLGPDSNVPPGNNQPGPGEDLDLCELLACVEACGPDFGCNGRCNDAAQPEALQTLTTYNACVQGCEVSMECVQATCPDEYAAFIACTLARS